MENINKFYQILTASYLRYIIISGGAFFLFYIWKKGYFHRFKIQKAFPKPKAISTEIKYSLLTTLIFSLVIYSFLFTELRSYTKLYENFGEHSIGYFIFSILLIIFIHDTYFYWTHRLMHWKKIFPYIHHIHHKSHNPTPLAAFSFHPLEAIVEVGILPIILFTIPVYKVALIIFGLYMVLMNVMGHFGYELFSKNFLNNPFTKWMNTSTHHNMHHHYSKGNYGLYFNIWDSLMGTNHKNYAKYFNKAVENRDTKLAIKNEMIQPEIGGSY